MAKAINSEPTWRMEWGSLWDWLMQEFDALGLGLLVKEASQQKTKGWWRVAEIHCPSRRARLGNMLGLGAGLLGGRRVVHRSLPRVGVVPSYWECGDAAQSCQPRHTS